MGHLQFAELLAFEGGYFGGLAIVERDALLGKRIAIVPGDIAGVKIERIDIRRFVGLQGGSVRRDSVQRNIDDEKRRPGVP